MVKALATRFTPREIGQMEVWEIAVLLGRETKSDWEPTEADLARQANFTAPDEMSPDQVLRQMGLGPRN